MVPTCSLEGADRLAVLLHVHSQLMQVVQTEPSGGVLLQSVQHGAQQRALKRE